MTNDPSPARLVAEADAPIVSTAAPVLVGVDGSPPSLHALDLAADEAALRLRDLRVVYTYRTDGAWAAPGRPEPPLAADAGALLAQVGERIRARHPALDFSFHTIEGDPVTVLVEESAGACLTVVGHRGIGGYAGLAAGSVSQQVLIRADGPVVVARGTAAAAGAPVVVAIDAATPDTARGPVEFALAEATLRKVRVEAVYAWTPPPAAPGREPDVRAAADALAEVLSRALPSGADVVVKSIVEPTGHPAAALVAATRGAGLVVIGPHEGSPLLHLQPGSVGAALLRQAHCPVAVVHRQSRG